MSEHDDKPEGEEDFAALFEATLKDAPKKGRLAMGTEVQGKVLQIGDEWTFLDIGGKGEATISTQELRDESGAVTVALGDVVHGRVTRSRDDGVIVSRVLQKGRDGGREMLEQAHGLGVPVEGFVKSVVKGGLEVEIAGVRTFCPASQIDDRFVADLTVHVGQHYPFRVTKYEEGGRNVIVSRRALLEEEKEKRAEETRKTLAVGSVFDGKVTSIREFGAFVDIGGIDGLLHVSELGHSRAARAADVLSVGQTVRVQVLKIEGDRLSLSMKSLLGDPWERAGEKFAVGSRHKGTVSRIQPFGAFVELAPGVDGLLHVSNLGDPRIKDPRQVLQEGQEVDVSVVTFDPTQKRIGLAMGEMQGSNEPVAGPGEVVKGQVERIETYGVFVRIPGPLVKGRPPRGLVPLEELGAYKGELKREFPIGSEMKVVVLEPDSQGRLRLSRKAAFETEERAEAAAYMQTTAKTGGKGGGAFATTFADLLKKKTDKK